MRYKVGWFIPHQVIALTHFVPEITPGDFTDILNATNECLKEAHQPFHIIIDNRIIKSEQVVPLEVILQNIPQLQVLPLRQVIMILPEHLRHRTANMESQRIGDTQLSYVESLAAGFALLQTMDSSLKWELQVPDFFAVDSAFKENE